jgi:hypothetical protein
MLSAARMCWPRWAFWSFGTMIAIAAVLEIAAFVEDAWPGSVITAAARNDERHADSARSSLRDLRRSLWRYGWFGRLAWRGMWCGIVAAVGVVIGVPWAALEERARRESREAVAQELVARQCGELPVIAPSTRVMDGLIRDDPDVTEEVDRLWRQYFDCRHRVLGTDLVKAGEVAGVAVADPAPVALDSVRACCGGDAADDGTREIIGQWTTTPGAP